MILYHGTNLKSAQSIYKNQTVNFEYSHVRTDFGRGFYMTDNYEYAKSWAIRKAFYKNDNPSVVKVEFDSEKAKNYIEIFSDDLRWGRFIINNRNGLNYIAKIPFKEHNIDSRYHITYGRIADVNVIKIAETLFYSNKMLQTIDEIYNKKYPMQYVLHTEFSLQFIQNITYASI